MRVYRISKCQFIDDLTGTGATYFGGRWHSKGTRVLYTASSASLALLEALVHITSVVPLKMCLMSLDIPDQFIKEIRAIDLPENWTLNPPPDVLKFYGDSLVKENKLLALKVPSVILPEEHNYILNPAHKLYSKIKIVYSRTISIDERLISPLK